MCVSVCVNSTERGAEAFQRGVSENERRERACNSAADVPTVCGKTHKHNTHILNLYTDGDAGGSWYLEYAG